MKFLLAAVALGFMPMASHQSNAPPTDATLINCIDNFVAPMTAELACYVYMPGEAEHALLMADMARPMGTDVIFDAAEAVPNSDSTGTILLDNAKPYAIRGKLTRVPTWCFAQRGSTTVLHC